MKTTHNASNINYDGIWSFGQVSNEPKIRPDRGDCELDSPTASSRRFYLGSVFCWGQWCKKRRSRSTENCDTEIFWPTNVVMGDLRAKWRPAERKQLKSFKDPRHSSIWVWRVYGVQPKRHILVGRWWLISHQTWEYYGDLWGSLF